MPKVMSASFSDRIASIIKELADEKGTSKSKVIEDLVEEGLRQRSFIDDIEDDVKATLNGDD